MEVTRVHPFFRHTHGLRILTWKRSLSFGGSKLTAKTLRRCWVQLPRCKRREGDPDLAKLWCWRCDLIGIWWYRMVGFFDVFKTRCRDSFQWVSFGTPQPKAALRKCSALRRCWSTRSWETNRARRMHWRPSHGVWWFGDFFPKCVHTEGFLW